MVADFMSGIDSFMRLDDALATLATTFAPVCESETLSLEQALGRILATDQISTLNVPPTDNSAMDGWAVHAAELTGGPLPIGGRIPAGHPRGEPVKQGHAYRIFTGASLPEGLDTVIMQEDAVEKDGAVILPLAAPGAHVRRAGEAIGVGDTPLLAGTVLQPQHLGVAATLGLAACLVPAFDGAFLSTEWKEALWARFYTAAPRRQRQSVEQYKIVKRA
ncbi:MAG TPA: hypothetical protein VK196_13235 [Magnetospirillum sp.]|nr:hypothetical protein [Magnetospirillum sp.]